MLRIPNLAAVLGLPSTSTLATVIFPANSSEISSTMGSFFLQGPHHSAQKSTRTGCADFSTTSSKLESLTAIAIVFIF